MAILEKECKKCGKIEVSEFKYRPIFDKNNWNCHDCQLEINKLIIQKEEEINKLNELCELKAEIVQIKKKFFRKW